MPFGVVRRTFVRRCLSFLPGPSSETGRSTPAETKRSEPGERTDDPVRMYLREMGSVELLSREGEIAIAKRIEEGLNQVQSSLASFPWSIQLLIEEYDQHTEGKKRLSEVLTGFADIEVPGMDIPDPMLEADAEAAANDDE